MRDLASRGKNGHGLESPALRRDAGVRRRQPGAAAVSRRKRMLSTRPAGDNFVEVTVTDDAAMVYVIDDDEALRDSIVFLLTTSGLEAAPYDGAEAFFAAVPRDTVEGCIVSDVRMPGMSGIELLKRLKSDGPDLPAIVITGHGDVPLAVEAMKLGAFDFIEKPFDDESLLNAVRTALTCRGEERREDGDREALLTRIATLTPREREVFNGLVEGHPNKTIAHDLGISPRTVEIYRANVMTKLQAGSLSELVRIAFVAEGTARTAAR